MQIGACLTLLGIRIHSSLAFIGAWVERLRSTVAGPPRGSLPWNQDRWAGIQSPGRAKTNVLTRVSSQYRLGAEGRDRIQPRGKEKNGGQTSLTWWS